MRLRRLSKTILFATLAPVEGLIRRLSVLGPGPIFDPRSIDGLAAMGDGWAPIAAELESLLADDDLPALGDIAPSQSELDGNHGWTVFFLQAYGQPLEANAARCPCTAALLAGIPGLCTAFFSILAPGKHIAPHRGIFNGTLRAHLGLLVPGDRSRCRMRIGDRTVHWSPGAWVVFDDTFEHEVWNETPHARAVLILDLVRPQRFPASLLTRMLLALIARSSFVRRARRNAERWGRQRAQVKSGGDTG